ncbi:protein MraZ [Candidatus Scalindua japonica]|uniref:Transcriptional regulator MraZ n=1 Tax=Candidatus Scalindua japonica TaxID=1284222 RepID=A0A286U1R0_9BACT|nr:division/cell wall cluster transcriptional repressor MraZ [Candidatus Scalindua japonica]GAX62080.1 protein MraZ [Candidatus Scalindua japonica]
MAIFTGKHLHTIDDKNRLAIPSSIRKCIDEESEGSGFFVTPGLDKCLALYSPLHFKEISEKYHAQVSTNRKARNFQRHFFSNSKKVDCDKQGRIIIPPMHMNYAGLNKDVIIVGVMDKIEIWDSKCWDEVEAENSESFEQDAEDLFCLGSLPSL